MTSKIDGAIRKEATESNQETIISHEETIITNNETIITNTENIETNTEILITTQTTIQANQTLIQNNQATIEANQTLIRNSQTQIQANQATIEANQTLIRNSQTQIQANQVTIEALAERVANARRTCRYYTGEGNSTDINGNCLTINIPTVDLPDGHTVHKAFLILEGCLVDTSDAENYLTGGTLQIKILGGDFWGATTVARCPYTIQAKGLAPIKLVADVGPPGGVVPAEEANGDYTARVTGATRVGASLRFNGHWILEIMYSV